MLPPFKGVQCRKRELGHQELITIFRGGWHPSVGGNENKQSNGKAMFLRPLFGILIWELSPLHSLDAQHPGETGFEDLMEREGFSWCWHMLLHKISFFEKVLQSRSPVKTKVRSPLSQFQDEIWEKTCRLGPGRPLARSLELSGEP